ncbi:MAG TPA: amidase [Ilumatobacteraceae bacterium]|nr:amidase [Ilumatobacteraceae bacterium]
MDSVESVRAALARLDASEQLGAVVWRDDAAVLAEAATHDRPPRCITVKDWIEVAGMPCEGESSIRTGRVPTRDATVVARLRAAGSVVIAKTQPGAEHPVHGRCFHPLDAGRTPGASSSGEGALLGAGASSLGLGSDSGGSIRLPAAWCGAVGLKPSFGLVPVTGHFPRVGGRHDGRTVIGPMATTVADVAWALSVIAGPDDRDPDCVPVGLGNSGTVAIEGLRVGVLNGDDLDGVAPSTLSATQRAVDLLVGGGAVTVDPLASLVAESLDITQRYWGRSHLSGADAHQQLVDWDRFRVRLERESARFDIVVSPVVAEVAPVFRALDGNDFRFMLPWSLTGWPAISVPFGVDKPTGLPLAVQIAAPRWHDHVVVAVAAALEGRG